MIPWLSFEGFNLNLQQGYDYLKPIFTMEKYVKTEHGTFLPLAIQVHHAVCDGFHVARFVEALQALINAKNKNSKQRLGILKERLVLWSNSQCAVIYVPHLGS